MRDISWLFVCPALRDYLASLNNVFPIIWLLRLFLFVAIVLHMNQVVNLTQRFQLNFVDLDLTSPLTPLVRPSQKLLLLHKHVVLLVFLLASTWK